MTDPARMRRVDNIRRILQQEGGRMKMRVLADRLAEQEGDDDVPYSAIHIAIGAENDRLEAQGKA